MKTQGVRHWLLVVAVLTVTSAILVLPVALSPVGNARFSGELIGLVPLQCQNPLFLIRIGPAFGAFAGRWLATGVEPRLGDTSEPQ